jgi:hypothetical protein
MKPFDTASDGAASHPDSLILGLAADWQAARAQALLAWAEADKRTCLGARRGDDADPPSEALARMDEAQAALAKAEPRTVRGACAMLDVAALILSHPQLNPDATLGQGPALEIVCNVRTALGFGDGDTPLRDGAA